ncbi:hypothetical protein CBR_g1052 [Chara braunii]|uniref:Thioredoxin domain-containing protein n=1 Tax=Chara braunii TaxID=69332 RepID=A0A388KDB2_CHABU|nr:hypothetical protein CBR_g1052 [Chara braunii]|eukprot:GBG67933.1 hypothetical protein CBR_g1052 [Chara braunii]
MDERGWYTWRRMATIEQMIWLVLVGILASPAAGLYADDGLVKVLTEKEYVQDVLEGPDMWLVEYFKSDCHLCVQVVPEFVKVANSLKGIVKVGAVNCDTNRDLCIHAKIKLFSWDRKKNPYTGKYYKDEPADYNGRSNSKAMTEFATDSLPMKFITLVSSAGPSGSDEAAASEDERRSASASEFLRSNPSIPKVLLFSKKDSVTPLYKGLSLRFRGRMAFAQASSSDAELAAQFNVTNFPTLLLIDQHGERFSYKGSLKAVLISEFLEPFAATASPPKDDGGEAAASDKSATGDQGAGGKGLKMRFIEQLNASRFQSMLASEDVWLVAFVGGPGGVCEERKEEWEKAAFSLFAMVHIGEVNVSSSPEAAALAEQYGLKSLVQDPDVCLAVLLFPFGDDKQESEPELYRGAMEAKELSKFTLEAIPSFVQHVTADSMQAFVNVQPNLPKVVLITTKTETPALFKTLATNYRLHLMFARVHSSEEVLLRRLGVEKVPHVLVLVQVANPTTGRVEVQAQHYGGPLNYPGLAYFLNQYVRGDATAQGDGSLLDGSSPSGVAVTEIDNQEEFKSRCISSGRVCMIGFFDGAVPEVEDHVDRFSQFASGSVARQFGLGWVDVSKFASVALKFGIAKRDVPTAVVLSSQKMRFALLAEEYGIQSLNRLLSGALSGKIRTVVLDDLPSFEERTPEDDVGEEVTEVEKEIEEEAAARRAEEEAVAKKAQEEAAAQKRQKKKKKKATKTAAPKDEL